MIREIKTYPNEILYQKAKEVEEIKSEEKELIKDMIETMHRKEGIGLAAPQVGVSKRIIVIDIGKGPLVLINPQILSQKGEDVAQEGCLSVPGEYLEIKRASEIKVKALDSQGEEINFKAKNLLARAIQHEVDHLDGVLILDKVSVLEKIKNKFF